MMQFIFLSFTSQTNVQYLDIKKVFDTISRNNLPLKLCHCGICGKLRLWFKSYLYFLHPVCLCTWSKVSWLSPSPVRRPTREYTRSPSFPHLYQRSFLCSAFLFSSNVCEWHQNPATHQPTFRLSPFTRRYWFSLPVEYKKSKLEFNCSKCVLMRYCPRTLQIFHDYIVMHWQPHTMQVNP